MLILFKNSKVRPLLSINVFEGSRKIHMRSVEIAVLQSVPNAASEETARALDLRRCVLALEMPGFETIMGKFRLLPIKSSKPNLKTGLALAEQASGFEVWKALVEVVHNLSEILLQTLPNFWKVGKAYMEGKYQSRSSSEKSHSSKSKIKEGRRSSSQVKVMTNEIINTYISLLGDFFTLSSSTALSPRINNNQNETLATQDMPKFASPNCNALAAGWWGLRVLGELSDCTNDIGGLTNLGSEAMNSLKEFMSSVRWRFTETVCKIWVKGVYLF